MKKLFIAVLLVASTLALTACKGDDEVITISVVTWAGDGNPYYDLGNQNFEPEDLRNVKVASMYATAKAFNEIYPNVKINYLGKVDGPDGGGVSWDEELANYQKTNGEFPSVFAVIDTVSMIEQGVLADLSMYEDTDLYKTLNPDLLAQGNFYGMQAVLPGYFIPHGMFINPQIIEDEFLDDVDTDWTFDEFSDLVENGQGADDGYSGLATLPASWAKQMFVYDALAENGRVDLNTDQVKSFFSDGMQVWNDSVFYTHEEEYVENHGSWAPVGFSDGVITVVSEEPWYMSDYAIEGGGMEAPEGFDVYPFPDYDGSGNTISTVMDPMGIYNFCGADGNPECTDEEQAKQDMAFEFAMFMIADTRAWQARADQEYGKVVDKQIVAVKGAADASLPVTTGDLFDEQMEIWYTIGSNATYKGKPGFETVIDIIADGGVNAISDKIYPWFYDDEVTGEREMIFHEFWDFASIGEGEDAVVIGSPEWQDTFESKLGSWTDTFNERLEGVWDDIEAALVKYYGYTADDERFN